VSGAGWESMGIDEVRALWTVSFWSLAPVAEIDVECLAARDSGNQVP